MPGASLHLQRVGGVGVGVGLCVVGQWDTPTEVHFMRQSLGKGAASETQDKL